MATCRLNGRMALCVPALDKRPHEQAWLRDANAICRNVQLAHRVLTHGVPEGSFFGCGPLHVLSGKAAATIGSLSCHQTLLQLPWAKRTSLVCSSSPGGAMLSAHLTQPQQQPQFEQHEAGHAVAGPAALRKCWGGDLGRGFRGRASLVAASGQCGAVKGCKRDRSVRVIEGRVVDRFGEFIRDRGLGKLPLAMQTAATRHS